VIVCCVDIDECIEEDVCEEHTFCVNTGGSYVCRVGSDAFMRDGNGTLRGRLLCTARLSQRQQQRDQRNCRLSLTDRQARYSCPWVGSTYGWVGSVWVEIFKGPYTLNIV